jgi:CubicO group peptidase (beta-lactamase class C family)
MFLKVKMQIPFLVAGLLCLVFIACTSSRDQHSTAGGDMTDTSLISLERKVLQGDYGKIHSYMLTINRKPIVEKYFNGWKRDSLHTMQSVTKSITSLLVGIAVDKGMMQTDDPIQNYLPEYKDHFDKDSLKRRLTIENILNMRSGIQWSEVPYDSSNLHKMNVSRKDWVNYVLAQPMREVPGTSFDYNSGSLVLLSRILWNATKMRTDSFAMKYLFHPLGILSDGWYRAPFDSLPHTGGGLFLSTPDMINIGLLILQQGKFNDKQIVSKEWLDRCLFRRIITKMGPYHVFYNSLWWLFPEDQTSLNDPSSDIITASGARGQWIMVFPKYQAAFVISGDNLPDFSVKILYNHIVPYLKHSTHID